MKVFETFYQTASVVLQTASVGVLITIKSLLPKGKRLLKSETERLS